MIRRDRLSLFVWPLAALSLGACAATGGGAPSGGLAKPAVASAPAAPVFVRSDVLAQTPASLDRTFGAPALTRREGAGEFRRYELAGCNLIVILYPDNKNSLSAQHADATAKQSDAPKPDLDQCLAEGLAKAVGA